MKNVFIKYNPYKLETTFEIDGVAPKNNSFFVESTQNKRLQEWVEKLPEKLIEEYTHTSFNIYFCGTVEDYDDIVAVVNEANEANDFGSLATFYLNERIEIKEVADKMKQIDHVFSLLKDENSPFPDLRTPAILNAFEKVKNNEFEVCVAATMSAGKSTLINAMLQRQLMPSKAEACTAIITRIKDNKQLGGNFKAAVYDKNKETPVHYYDDITLELMKDRNAEHNITEIKIEGNIPFVDSKEIFLVMIDTPGPNNARDTSHEEMQMNLFKNESKALVLYVMTGEFGTKDDKNVLNAIAQAMDEGGKVSRDRFLFVINKLDERKKEDGKIEQTLDSIKKYLEDNGIKDPRLFPASALAALNIRMVENEIELDENTIDETEVSVRKLNRTPDLHLEKHAPLPKSVRNSIDKSLQIATEQHSGSNSLNNPQTALIHTGVVSIEQAINQYVEKYAKTAKIRDVVNTFIDTFKKQDHLTTIQEAILKDEKKREKILEDIEKSEKKMGSAEAAKNFKESVERSVKKVNADSENAIKKSLLTFDNKIRKLIDSSSHGELTVEEAKYEVKRLQSNAKDLANNFNAEIKNIIENTLKKTSNELINDYRNKLAALADESGLDTKEAVLSPIKVLGADIKNVAYTTQTREEREFVKNLEKSFWKPWTWLQEKGYYRTNTTEFVAGDELRQGFLMQVQKYLDDSQNSAMQFVKTQSKSLAQDFNKKFGELDNVLKETFKEMKDYATNKEEVQERIEENEKKKLWLENIKVKVEELLEI